MGIFSRKRSAAPATGGASTLQVPDELAQEAALAYGNGNFVVALDTYGTAIDKLHTMCVMADRGSRIRTPGPADQPILDGFNNSLGVVLSDAPKENYASLVQRSASYLREIAAEAGGESGRYLEAANAIESTYSVA